MKVLKLLLFFAVSIILVFAPFSQTFAQTSWGDPQILVQIGGYGGIAVGPDGTAHAVWQGNSEIGQQEAFYSYKSPISTTWSDPKNLTISEGRIQTPLIAVGGDNFVHVIWYSQEEGVIKYTYKKPFLNQWSHPQSIPSEDLDFDLTAAQDGSVHVVWSDTDEIFYISRPSHFVRPPVGWSSPINISNTSSGSGRPRVAVGGNTSVHVVWGDSVPGVPDSYYTTKTSSGLWSSPEFIPGISSQSAEIAVGQSGIPHVVGDHSGMLGYTTKIGGFWLETTDIPGSDCYQWKQIAIDSSQQAHVTWLHNTTCGSGTDSIMYSGLSGSAWTEPINISRNITAGNPHSLSVAPDGSLHLVFDSPSPTGTIYYVSGLPTQ